MIERAPSVRTPTPIALAVILSVVFAVSANAAPVTIAWTPSPDEAVIGYQVFVGTASRSYTETFDLGLATSFTYSPADGSIYYFAVASYSVGPLLGPLSREVSTATTLSNATDAESYWSSLWTNLVQALQRLRSDRESLAQTALQGSRPSVQITVPTPGNSYSTNQPFVTLGGRVIDDGGVSEVTWTTSRGHSGRASGTESWIAGVPLERGANTITIRARDQDGNVSTRAIVVNLTTRRSDVRTIDDAR